MLSINATWLSSLTYDTQAMIKHTSHIIFITETIVVIVGAVIVASTGVVATGVVATGVV